MTLDRKQERQQQMERSMQVVGGRLRPAFIGDVISAQPISATRSANLVAVQSKPQSNLEQLANFSLPNYFSVQSLMQAMHEHGQLNVALEAQSHKSVNPNAFLELIQSVLNACSTNKKSAASLENTDMESE